MKANNFMSREDILKSIISWAERSSNVEALIQTGSLARRDNLADDLSDLDIEIISADPDVLVNDDGWITEIGHKITVLSLENGRDWDSRLTIYEGGTKVDFTLAGTSRVLDMVESGVLDPLYERGYFVVLDKSGVTGSLPTPSYGWCGQAFCDGPVKLPLSLPALLTA